MVLVQYFDEKIGRIYRLFLACMLCASMWKGIMDTSLSGIGSDWIERAFPLPMA